MNSLSNTNNSIDFSRNLLTFGNNSIGSQINWSKVFNDTTGVFYPNAINWNNSVDNNLDFDTKTFVIERSGIQKKVDEIVEVIDKKINRLNTLIERNKLDSYYLKDIMDSIIKSFKDLFFLGTRIDGSSEIYEQEFFLEFMCIQKKIENQLLVLDFHGGNEQNQTRYLTSSKDINTTEIDESKQKDSIMRQIATIKCLSGRCLNPDDKTDVECIVSDLANESLAERINFLVEKGFEWKDKALESQIEKEVEFKKSKADEFIKDDKSLNVDKIIEVINSGFDWNYDGLIIAFYNSTCSKSELTRLQNGVFNTLNGHLKSINVNKMFLILEYILPFIYEGADVIFEIPELFLPIYLNHINVYNLTLEGFISQVNENGKKLGWSEEIRNKLIEQFKQYGQAEEGKIAFGQGSEQLWYWQRVVGGINKENIGQNTIKDDLGVENRPRPKILDGVDDSKQIINSKISGLLESK